MPRPIRKAVLPVAGLGTRFLPATKAVPKEMLPVVDRPLVEYAVEEAREAGVEDFIFVAGRSELAIENHFDHTFELEAVLEAKGKIQELEALRAFLPPPGRVFFTRQQQPLGLGHAVWCARELVGDEPFAILLPDDLVLARKGCLSQLVAAYEQTGGNVVAVEDIPREHTNRYGVLKPGKIDGRLVEVKGLVEKPEPEAAPSTLSIIGRYILLPEVFEHLARQERGAGGEIQITDAMARMIGRSPFHGYRFEGDRYDCGNKLGYLAANVAYGLAREDIGPEFREFLTRLLKRDR